MVYLNGSLSPLNMILPQVVYVSCSIKAGAVGFALYRCPFHHVHHVHHVHHHVHHVLKNSYFRFCYIASLQVEIVGSTSSFHM